MKKILLSGICALLSITAAQAAPDTLTLTNIKTYTSYTGRDNLRNVRLDSSIFPAFNTPNTVSGNNWDLRGNIKYDTTSFPKVTRLAGVFPAQYADSIPHQLGNIYFYSDNQTTLTINYGLSSMGETIDSQYVVANRIPASKDTIIFSPQNNLYYTPSGIGYAYYYTLGLFPFTFHSNWQSNFRHSSSFALIDSTLGYNHVPGAIYFNNTRTDTIIGYGTMSLVLPYGDTAKNVKILQCKTITTERDSFTLNGSPFSPALLAALGLTQGMTSATYSYQFFREGRLATPFMRVWYTNNNFSTISKVWIDTLYAGTVAPPAPSIVPEIININSDVTIYPNPVTGRVVNIAVANASNGAWSCELMNISGQQVVASSNMSLSGGKGEIVIPSGLAPGMYYLRVSNDNRPVAIKAISIQ